MHPLPCSDTASYQRPHSLEQSLEITVVVWEGPRVLYVTSPSCPFYFRVSTKFGLTLTPLLQSGLTRVSRARGGSTRRKEFGWGEGEEWRPCREGLEAPGHFNGDRCSPEWSQSPGSLGACPMPDIPAAVPGSQCMEIPFAEVTEGGSLPCDGKRQEHSNYYWLRSTNVCLVMMLPCGFAFHGFS